MRPRWDLPSVKSFLRVGAAASFWAGGFLTAMTIAAGAQAQSGSGAVYAVTYLDVAANMVRLGSDLIKQYRDTSRQEADNLEFTVLQELGRPNRFVIFEGWKDQATFDAHAKAPSTERFLGALKPMRNSPPDRHVLQAFATAPARAEPAGGALVMVEHVDFQPGFSSTAMPLIKALAEASQKEPGALRYDVYQQPAPRTNHYTVVGVWSDANGFDAHEAAEPTHQFRAATAPPARANLYDQRRYRVF
jgi:quinol monooxygenase YgiN